MFEQGNNARNQQTIAMRAARAELVDYYFRRGMRAEAITRQLIRQQTDADPLKRRGPFFVDPSNIQSCIRIVRYDIGKLVGKLDDEFLRAYPHARGEISAKYDALYETGMLGWQQEANPLKAAAALRVAKEATDAKARLYGLDAAPPPLDESVVAQVAKQIVESHERLRQAIERNAGQHRLPAAGEVIDLAPSTTPQ